MSTLKKISFHEATIKNFFRHEDIIELEIELENFLVNRNKSRVILKALQVSAEGGHVSDISLMEAPDGEVLSLELSNNSIYLIVEWNNFSIGISFVKSYKILGEKILILDAV